MPTIKNDPVLLARIGSRIRDARSARELTQATLAERVGIEPLTLTRYEGGSRGPSLTTLAAIANALDVSMADLVADDRPVPEPLHRPPIDRAIRVLDDLDDKGLTLAVGIVELIGDQTS